MSKIKGLMSLTYIDYGQLCGPHYLAYFHTRDIGGRIVGAHHWRTHMYVTSKVHIVDYGICIQLKLVCIYQNSNIGRKGGYITGTWQM